MSKYAPLTAHLRASAKTEIPMTFGHVETVIGAKLPESAYRHRSWWSNNPNNSVVTRAWIEAGYISTGVDMARRTLVFRRTAPGEAPDAHGGDAGKVPERGPLAGIFGALKGMVTIKPGTDLTEPTGTEWDAMK